MKGKRKKSMTSKKKEKYQHENGYKKNKSNV